MVFQVLDSTARFADGRTCWFADGRTCHHVMESHLTWLQLRHCIGSHKGATYKSLKPGFKLATYAMKDRTHSRIHCKKEKANNTQERKKRRARKNRREVQRKGKASLRRSRGIVGRNGISKAPRATSIWFVYGAGKRQGTMRIRI